MTTKPFFKLNHGDCVDCMDTMPENSIDLTVTSPPYDSLRAYEGLSFEKFKSFAKQLFKITKPRGTVVWVVNDATVKGSETGTSFKQALYFKEIGFNLHDTMIYAAHKSPQNHNRYEPAFEYMFVLSKLGAPKSFNSIRIPTIWGGTLKTGSTYRQPDNSLTAANKNGLVKLTKIAPNIFYYSVGFNKSTTDKEAHIHPAIFPEKLAKDMILSWSNVGDLIFDPFSGSGTTGKMAVLTGRNFIGCEKNLQYFEIMKSRIKRAYETLTPTKMKTKENEMYNSLVKDLTEAHLNGLKSSVHALEVQMAILKRLLSGEGGDHDNRKKSAITTAVQKDDNNDDNNDDDMEEFLTPAKKTKSNFEDEDFDTQASASSHVAPAKKRGRPAKTSTASQAPADFEDGLGELRNESFDENNQEIDGDEEKPVSKEQKTARAKKRLFTMDDVNDAAKALVNHIMRTRGVTGKEARQMVEARLVKHFDAKSVTEIDPSDYETAVNVLQYQA